jgi:glyoxylase-like metal-dependent hydrolase (beta-lactamase superfamily II)
MKASINQISDDLNLITLNPPMDGFDNFIGAWLYRGELSFLVDVGPASTAEGLLRVLDDSGVDHLDYILLTHIHLDHAGAIGEIAEKFSQTPIICHPTGIPHLIDPARLWEGTKKTLGSTAEGYGPIKAVASDRFVDAEQFTSDAILPLITPGHASHHVSYNTKNYLFAGETAGVYYAIPPNRFYLRPATPPRFFFDTAVESIDKLIAGNPTRLCYGHYGMTDDGPNKLQKARRQFFSWKAIIEDEIKKSNTDDPIEKCKERLLREDLMLANFLALPESAQRREDYFLRNSIKGFIGYLRDRSGESKTGTVMKI